DREFIRKVGESPPPYRSRGVGKLFPHTNSRPAMREVGIALSVVDRTSSPSMGSPSAEDSTVGIRSVPPGDVRRSDAPAALASDLPQLARRLGILPSRIPHLIAAASGADTRDRLGRIMSERITVDRLREWAQSSAGRRFLDEHGADLHDNFRNRLR